jgi:hypothetical protein
MRSARTKSSRRHVWLDDLDLRDAVFGDGILLLPGPEFTLYSVTPGRARLLGSFVHAVDAWAALDALVPEH